ncbi:MAG TPA: hypothetical protein VEY09_19145 [Pyrinomonadaceae bacterium]|nr:hypothetical protein [Pyrinomonadaceae bacterium]
MVESLPPYVAWVFALTTVSTVIIYLYAVRAASRHKSFLTAAVLVILLGMHAALASNGFYLANTNPPRFPLAPLPTIIILLILFFAFSREGTSDKSLKILTLLSVVRVPVELVLLWLYRHGEVPRLMTFEGRNFDILSGLTAPLVAWFAFRGDKVNRPLLVVWNLFAFGLLLNIVANAILSLETPFQQFAFDQPNRGVLYFPFIWLPAIIVPVVFVAHVISLWQLSKRRGRA